MALSNSGGGSSSGFCGWNDDWVFYWEDDWWRDVNPNDFWDDDLRDRLASELSRKWFYYLNPPTYDELTDRYKASFTFFPPYITSVAEYFLDDTLSLDLIFDEITSVPFDQLLNDTQGQTRLQLRSIHVARVDGTGTFLDYEVREYIHPSAIKATQADGTVDNPGVTTPNRIIKIPIKDPITNLPTGNTFWVTVWFQVAPPI